VRGEARRAWREAAFAHSPQFTHPHEVARLLLELA